MPFWINLLAGLISFAIAGSFGLILIPYLRKLKAGSHILDIGPAWHKSKEGTPLMGGFMFILSVPIAAWVAYICIKMYRTANMIEAPEKAGLKLLLAIAVSMLFMLIGFADDYIKVVKKRSLGLTPLQKMALQFIVTGVFIYYYFKIAGLDTSIKIPFVSGDGFVMPTWLFIIFVFIVVLGTVNGVNFTDGLDGLASGVTVIVATFFTIAALSLNPSMTPITGAVVGSLLGFLLFNTYPARVFMGDTGSLALSGFVSSIALMLHMPLFIVIIGLIYLVEVLSVILQVGYFKLTHGKRIFKMAPIHHHFELCGYSETQVVAAFSIVTALLCLVGIMAL